jgi:hypothetical protein
VQSVKYATQIPVILGFCLIRSERLRSPEGSQSIQYHQDVDGFLQKGTGNRLGIQSCTQGPYQQIPAIRSLGGVAVAGGPGAQ